MEILLGIRHGLADLRERGEMEDGFRLHRFDGGEDVPLLLRPGKNEFRARVHRRAVAFREIVIDRNLMPGIEQLFRANRPDITGAAGDKDVHKASVENIRPGESSKRNRFGE